MQVRESWCTSVKEKTVTRGYSVSKYYCKENGKKKVFTHMNSHLSQPTSSFAA